MASSLRPHKFPFEAYSSKFFAIFNFFSANSNPIANNFYYKGSAKNKRYFRYFFCLYMARPQISDSRFCAGFHYHETQSPISQEAKKQSPLPTISR